VFHPSNPYRTQVKVSYYFGDWKNSKRNGKGLECSAGNVYEGDWVDDECHGRGAVRFEITESTPGNWFVSYEGDYKHRQMTGRGFAVFVDHL